MLYYIIAGLVFILASFQVASWELDKLGPSCPAGERVELNRPFDPFAGSAFSSAIPEFESLRDTSDHPQRSPLILCEGNMPMGPAHALHADIVDKGEGRFSHWGSYVIFSASDNSSPNTNGRTYVVVAPR